MLLTKGKNKRVSNLKFLGWAGILYMMFSTSDVLNSARFDLISFSEKIEINFELVSSGPPVLTNFL